MIDEIEDYLSNKDLMCPICGAFMNHEDEQSKEYHCKRCNCKFKIEVTV